MLQRLRAARRSDGGFTVVELQVVLAILGVLSGTAFAAAHGFESRAVATACRLDTRNVATASAAYLAENGSYATAIDDPTHSATTLVGADLLTRVPSSTEYTITYNPADGTAICIQR